MRVLGPILGDQQREIAAPDMIAPWRTRLCGSANRHSHLLADGTIAGIQRRLSVTIVRPATTARCASDLEAAFSSLLLLPRKRPRRQLMPGPLPAEMEACDR